MILILCIFGQAINLIIAQLWLILILIVRNLSLILQSLNRLSCQ